MSDGEIIGTCGRQFMDVCRDVSLTGRWDEEKAAGVERVSRMLRRLLRKKTMPPSTEWRARELLAASDGLLSEMDRVDSLGVFFTAVFYVSLFALVVFGVLYAFRGIR